SLTSSGASSVTGSVGYGESITNTGTNARTNQATTTDVTSTSPTGPGTMHTVATIAGGLLATATHTALRPFSYSVSPTRSETLTITAAPALGAQAQASPEPAGTPTLTKSKVTDTYNAEETDPDKLHSHTEEQTLVSPKPAPRQSIYDVYQKFAHSRYLSRLP